MSDQPILVTFLSRGSGGHGGAMLWLRQFPGCEPIWGRCQFTFEPTADRYDWLVVYDDFPSRQRVDHSPAAAHRPSD